MSSIVRISTAIASPPTEKANQFIPGRTSRSVQLYPSAEMPLFCPRQHEDDTRRSFMQNGFINPRTLRPQDQASSEWMHPSQARSLPMKSFENGIGQTVQDPPEPCSAGPRLSRQAFGSRVSITNDIHSSFIAAIAIQGQATATWQVHDYRRQPSLEKVQGYPTPTTT